MSYSLSFSKAILVLVFISDKDRLEQYEFLSSKMISEVLNIPKPTLVKILHGLNLAGIIETREGKTGGIKLAKSPKSISVLDILKATEGMKSLFNTSFNLSVSGKRPSQVQKSVAEVLNTAEKNMKAELAATSLADILQQANS